jgi:hypothetical protein
LNFRTLDNTCNIYLNSVYNQFLFEHRVYHSYQKYRRLLFFAFPVVRGAPNVKELIPPKTFISTQDYKSPADLAKHLKEIGSNEATYTAILKTKQKYIITLDMYLKHVSTQKSAGVTHVLPDIIISKFSFRRL